MRITTTDGQEYTMPDMCGYCNMDTAGNHEMNCPCRQPLGVQMVSNPIFNILIKQGLEDIDSAWLLICIVESGKVEKLEKIRAKSHLELGEAWGKLAEL